MFVLLGLAASLCILGCGGSSSSSGGPPPAAPDFTFSVAASTPSITPGGTAASIGITVSPTNGFTGSVVLSVSGVPSGVTASLTPPNIAITTSGTAGISTLSLTASPSAPAVSSQTITLQATNGSITHTATFNLTVTPPPGISISAPASLAVYPGTTESLAVNVSSQGGFDGPVTVSLSGLPAGITALQSSMTTYPGTTLNFSLNVAANATSSGTVTIAGTSGTLSSTAQTTFNLTTTPDFALNIMGNGTYIYNGSAESEQVFALTAYNGFSAPVTVTLGNIPSGVTVSPTSFTFTGMNNSPNLTITVPFGVSVPGTISIPVQATSGTLSHSLTWNINFLQNHLSILAPASASVHAGSSVSASVGIQTLAAGNTIGTLSLSVSSTPAGFTVTPMQGSYTGNGGQTFYIQAAANATSGNIIFTGTWNSLTTTATVPVTVLPASVNTPTSVRSRNAYVRTDSTADYLGFPPPNWSLYDSTTGRFFSTDYGTSRLNIFDSATEKQIGFLNIPNPFGIGQVGGKGTLYVGTMSGDIYLVDPVAMTVTKRIASASIGPSGFYANAIYPRPDGTLLLESYFLVPEYSWVDGYNHFALWNPSTNALTTLPDCSNGPIARTTFGFPTNNGARLLTMPQILSPATTLLCSVDLSTGNVITLPAPSGTGTGGYLSTLALSPDGNTVAGYDGTNIWVIDAATLTVKNKFAASSSTSLAATPSLLIGSDNQTVYLTGADSGEHILVYNMSTGQLTGWLPAVQVAEQASYSPSVPFLQGLSANGLLGGVMEQGFGFIDTNAVNPPPVGTAFGMAILSNAYGPTFGGTDTSWSVASQGTTTTTPSLGSTYFGSAAATGLSLGTNGFDATTPAGAPGPVDVTTVTPDGGEQLLPEGFSYGPFVVEAPTTYATAEGGGPAQVYGYGFGFGSAYVPNTSTQVVAPPSDLQILVGGANAQVTGYLPGPYSSLNYISQPFPLVGAEYKVPPGTVGTSASIVVSNSTGSATAAQKITYLPATVSYPLTNASLYDGIYDSTRDLYYFTDATQVQVFSRTQGKWLAPIPVPQPTYPYGPERLHALNLSPDHSKLVVSDSGSMALDLINLANGNAIQSFGLASSSPPPQGLNTITPAGVAVTNSGQMFFDTYDQNGDGAAFLYTLDSTTGQYSIIGGTQALYGQVGYPQSQGNAPWTRLVISPNGQTIYFANEGLIGAVNTSTGIGATYCNACTDLTDGGYDIVLGSDGSTLFADGAFVDTQLNLHALQSLNYRESFDADYLYGAALSADNTLLFQPGTQSIDVFATDTGSFLERVSLPQQLNPYYRALISDGKDNILIAITSPAGTGIAVIDLSSLPAVAPLPHITEPDPGPLPNNSTSSSTAPQRRRPNPTAPRFHSGFRF